MHRSSWTEHTPRPVARWALALFAWSVTVAPAQAQPDAPEDPEALITRGLELRQAAEDAEAVALFERAYAIEPTARALAQLALAEQALGRWVEARGHLEEALALDDAWIGRHRETLERARDTMDERVAQVTIVTEESARVQLNGRVVERMPAWVLAGTVVVAVEAEGFRAEQRELQVQPRESLRVELPLTPQSASALAVDPTAGDPAVADRGVGDPEPSTEGSGAGDTWLAVGVTSAVVAGLALGAMIPGLVIAEDAAVEYNACPPPMSSTCADARSRNEAGRAAGVALGVTAGLGAVLATIAFVLSSTPAGAPADVAWIAGPGLVGAGLEVAW